MVMEPVAAKVLVPSNNSALESLVLDVPPHVRPLIDEFFAWAKKRFAT